MMTKQKILAELLEVVKILEMDYHNYIEYKRDCLADNPCNCVIPTDYYNLFRLQSVECLEHLSFIFRGCVKECEALGGFSFLVGRFVCSDHILSDEEVEKLHKASGWYMNTYGAKEYGKDWDRFSGVA